MTEDAQHGGEVNRSPWSGYPQLKLGRAALGIVLFTLLGGQMVILSQVSAESVDYGGLAQVYQIAFVALMVYIFAPQVMWFVREGIRRIHQHLVNRGVLE